MFLTEVINFDNLQKRLNACRSMYEADKKDEAKCMLRDLAADITDTVGE